MTPDELRSAIAQNPSDPAERGRLINAAIENNQVDEIPPDWSFQVGTPPDEPQEREVEFDYGEWNVEPTRVGLVRYGDNTVAIVDVSGAEYGDTIFDFNPDPLWTDAGLMGLRDLLDWASEIDFGQLMIWMGERQPDQRNGLFVWQGTPTYPGDASRDLIVGLNPSGQVTIMFPEGGPLRAVSFPDEEAVGAAYNGIEELIEDLGDENG